MVLRRRRRFAVHYSSLSLIRQAMPGGFRWRRHLPFALMVLAIALLVVALARPFANVTVASSRTTVMLALDVSLSMCADDVDPNRLTIAQTATERFIESQEPGTRVGIVAFAGIAQLIVPPTTDREVLLEAVANLTTARATAVGSAIARSLDALAEVNPDIAPVSVYVSPREDAADAGLEEGLQPDVIVLLTDGASNRGVSPLAAARAASDRGVRVYTIGFGTANPAVLRCTPEQLGGDEFARRIDQGGFGSFGRRNFGNFGRGGFWTRELSDAGRVDPDPRRRDHGRRVLPGRERGRASSGLLHNTRADREEEGAHGGLGRADRHRWPPRPHIRRTRSLLEPAALNLLPLTDEPRPSPQEPARECLGQASERWSTCLPERSGEPGTHYKFGRKSGLACKSTAQPLILTYNYHSTRTPRPNQPFVVDDLDVAPTPSGVSVSGKGSISGEIAMSEIPCGVPLYLIS